MPHGPGTGAGISWIMKFERFIYALVALSLLAMLVAVLVLPHLGD